ncbi:histidine phosphatase family protein [Streptomyces exfoliatus]|uniref:Histidine phosphatase family protein n=1 Tax=Streptomyces exfoliatus TaxID=1905 RepID=A0ABV3D3I1_STREX
MTVTARLVIARHAEARCNVEGRVGGPRTCTGLTDTGRHQAVRLATRLNDEQHAGAPAFHALYAGTRLRVQETGRILAAALQLPLVIDEGLDGPRHGNADGQLWRDVEDAFQGAPETRPDRPYAAGSETWHEYLARAMTHLTCLIHRHKNQSILLAAHGETVHAACHLLLRIPAEASPAIGFGTDHTGITRFEHRRDRYGNERWLLTTLNDTTHLGARPS